MMYLEIHSLKVDSIPPNAGCRKMGDFEVSAALTSSPVQQLIQQCEQVPGPVGAC